MTVAIYSRALGGFGTNCYIVACTESKRCAVIDPGTPDAWILHTIAEHELTVDAILLTHGHLDHIGGVERVKASTGAPVLIHADDAQILTDPLKNGSAAFGLRIVAPAPDRLLADGDTVPVGNLQLRVLHTPGHTRGGICLFVADGAHLFAGDTLFAGSIGRTDLEGGDYDTLIASILTKLLALPDETVVYPGHGPSTTIGDEREYSPFLS